MGPELEAGIISKNLRRKRVGQRKRFRDRSQSTRQQHQARPRVPAEALLSGLSALFDQKLNVENWILGVDTLQEVVDQRGDPFLLGRIEPPAGGEDISISWVTRKTVLVGREQGPDQSIRGISLVEDLPAEHAVGARSVRRNL